MRIYGLTMLTTLLLAAVTYAQVPVTGAPGTKLSDIAGTSTLVTVVMKDSGARDKNLKIKEIGDTYFTVETAKSEHYAYTFAAIREVQVQGGKVEAKEFKIDVTRALTEDEQKVLDRAYQRAEDIFGAADNRQDVKMLAAVILVLADKEEARTYLNQIAASNDLRARLMAAHLLYLAGDTSSAKAVLDLALASGERKTKSSAAQLAGLVGYHPAVPTLLSMVQDRSADYMSSAAVALARLGNRDCIPVLLSAITSLDATKRAAAAQALTLLGGPDTIEQMKLKLKDVQGDARYRAVYVLYKLGDPLGKQLLMEECLKNPLQALDAAILLAADGEPTGARWLRESFLTRPTTTSTEALIKRARAAGALMAFGDASAITHLQELLRASDPKAQSAACEQIARLGRRNLLILLQASIESNDFEVATVGIDAAVAIVNQEFRERRARAAMS